MRADVDLALTCIFELVGNGLLPVFELELLESLGREHGSSLSEVI